MIGDPSAIRALARPLRHRADEVRALADRLVGTAQATRWEGLAAEAMRGAVRGSASGLRRTAGIHDDAADALERYADDVAAAQAVIRAALDALKKALTHPLGAL
jgi:uncharacterized protein YukE